MHRTDDRFPFRQATRLVNEMQFAVTAVGLALAGRNLERVVLILALLRHALRYGVATPVSLHALASSLRRSPETLRRQARELVRLGYCRQEGRLTYLVDDFMARGEVRSAERHLAARFDRMVAGFVATGFSLPSGLAGQPEWAVVEAALDIYLSAYELSEALQPNLADMYVIGAIAVHNAANITHDPVLAERYGYADTVPPLSLRRPISIRSIAAIDDLPYATIHRHVEAAEKAGVICREGGGWYLAQLYMDSPQTNAASRTKIRYVRRVLIDLAQRRSASP